MTTKLSQNEDFTIVTKGGGQIVIPNVVAEPQFNPTSAYAVDAKVWYGSVQYVCTTATTEPAEGQSNPTPEEDAAHWAALPIEEMAKKSAVDPLLFAQYYPDGSVKSAAEFTAGIKYDDPDTTNRTITVKPFCNTGTAENDNSDLVGRVVIPPFVDGDGNGYISDDWTRFKVVGVSGGSPDRNNANLTAIVAPNTVTTIGDRAFKDCTALVTISLPAATTIGDRAFRDCTALVTISLPAATTIWNMAFYGCTALVAVSLPAATTIGPDAFYGCTALVAVSLPAATTIETDAFISCTKLTSVLLPVATVIRFAVFYKCASLTSVDFGDTPRSSVPFLGNNAFEYVPTSCKIIVPDAQYDEWVAAPVWSDLVTAGYKFLRHSEWEYARKYEVDKKADKPATFTAGNLAKFDANGNLVDSGLSKDEVPGLSVDNTPADVNIVHISQENYEQLVFDGNALSNTLYVVSGDYINAYGQQIKNIAPGNDLSDAVNVEQLNAIDSKTQCLNAISSNSVLSDFYSTVMLSGVNAVTIETMCSALFELVKTLGY